MFKQISPLTKNSFGNQVLTVAHRCQSSFTFLNNQSLLQKEQLKQSKRKNKRSICRPEGDYYKTQHVEKKMDGGSSSKKPKKYDYSWLPRVPSTNYLKPRDMSSKILYSGYRPLFLNPDELKISQGAGNNANDSAKLYAFAMKLEELGERSLWACSATGQEIYPEWDYVPLEVQKKLKPFNAPASLDVDKEAEKNSLKRLKAEVYVKEKDKLLNRSRGRKRPVVSLLQLRKKLNQD